MTVTEFKWTEEDMLDYLDNAVIGLHWVDGEGKDGSTLSVLIASSGLFDEEKNFVHTRCFTIKDPAA